MGVALGKIGRFNEALEYLQRARALEPDSALIHYNIGVTYHRMNNAREEIRAYITAIRANPRMAAAHYNLGLAFLSQGRRQLALGQYEILKTLKPDIADQGCSKRSTPRMRKAKGNLRMDSDHQCVPDSEILLTLARTKMPFGRYRGRLLIDLPEPYIVWFAQKGFPSGSLGELLRMVYEIKVNGLEYLFNPLRIPESKD